MLDVAIVFRDATDDVIALCQSYTGPKGPMTSFDVCRRERTAVRACFLHDAIFMTADRCQRCNLLGKFDTGPKGPRASSDVGIRS